MEHHHQQQHGHRQAASESSLLTTHIQAPPAHDNVIRPYDYTESDCGYCKGSRCHLVNKPPARASKSYSLLADSMTPSLYEGFMYRGWRRSGIHLYKPCNFESCCPTLTIRLPTKEYVPTKSQSKLQRRMNHLISGTPVDATKSILPKPTTDNDLQRTVQQTGILDVMEEITNVVLLNLLTKDVLVLLQQHDQAREWKSKYRLVNPSKKDRKLSQLHASCNICAQICGSVQAVLRQDLVERVVQDIHADKRFHSLSSGGSVSVVSLVAHPPSGQIRCTFRVEDQLMSDQHSSTFLNSRSDKIQEDASKQDKLAEWYRKTTGMQLKLDQRRITVHTMPAHQSALDPKVHRLYVCYQTTVHNDPNPFLGERKKDGSNESNDQNPSQKSPGLGEENHDDGRAPSEDSDEILTNPNDLDWGNAPGFFKGRIGDMLSSYLSPVQEQHRKVVLENYYSFYQFLVEAPFPLSNEQQRISPPQIINDVPRDKQKINNSQATPKIDCGLYHQHYRLGEMLIAVGVVDVLPAGLSSVYLFYHPTFSHNLVALGKYAILKEIEYARDILKLPYYYLGYYIESCQKMRYKAEYKPSQILCPKYYHWVDAPEAIAKLQQTPLHVCPLIDRSMDEEEETAQTNAALHQLQMDIGAGINVTIDMLQPSGVEVVKPILENFVAEAGPDLSVRCLVKLG
ncbi:arginyl-tRNA-protein transferase [Nitzschia inconspicua]|uniref:arginyltransferase n=1 Tax=Nitzschia inconspicua TaxID=303405 RepID=A0A9K3KYD5_9STRA|nr:arginyl-tRNA-protein transferase [Nitzschia inconspicua]